MDVNIECKVTNIDHKDRPIDRNNEIMKIHRIRLYP
jgi:hypothetical protein